MITLKVKDSRNKELKLEPGKVKETLDSYIPVLYKELNRIYKINNADVSEDDLERSIKAGDKVELLCTINLENFDTEILFQHYSKLKNVKNQIINELKKKFSSISNIKLKKNLLKKYKNSLPQILRVEFYGRISNKSYHLLPFVSNIKLEQYDNEDLRKAIENSGITHFQMYYNSKTKPKCLQFRKKSKVYLYLYKKFFISNEVEKLTFYLTEEIDYSEIYDEIFKKLNFNKELSKLTYKNQEIDLETIKEIKEIEPELKISQDKYIKIEQKGLSNCFTFKYLDELNWEQLLEFVTNKFDIKEKAFELYTEDDVQLTKENCNDVDKMILFVEMRVSVLLRKWNEAKSISIFSYQTIRSMKKELEIEESVKLVMDGKIKRVELDNDFQLYQTDIIDNSLIKEAVTIEMAINLCSFSNLSFVLPFDTKIGALKQETERQIKVESNILQIKCGLTSFKDDDLVIDCWENNEGKIIYCSNTNEEKILEADYNCEILIKDIKNKNEIITKYLLDRICTIENVKIKLRDNLNIPSKAMQLYYNERLLDDNTTLEKEDINDGDSLFLLKDDNKNESTNKNEATESSVLTIVVKNGTSTDKEEIDWKVNESSNSVKNLKEEICSKFNLKYDDCLLLFNDDIMREKNNIDAYDLTNGSVVTVCWCIYVKSIDNVGALRSFPLMCNQKVIELKKIIKHYMDLAVDLQILQYNSEILKNDEELIEHYDVEPKAHLFLVSTLRGGLAN